MGRHPPHLIRAGEIGRRIGCAREEGIFAGTSAGGNVAVALRIPQRLGRDRTVVPVAVDSGMMYLSTPLYANA